MRKIRLIIQYDGTQYCGWQRQVSDPSIQGKIENAAGKLFQREISIHGAGRTDSGVHALGQVAHCSIESTISDENILSGLNTYLPNDIRIIGVATVDAGFDARRDARRRHYRYRIFTGKVHSPMERLYSLHYPYALDITLLRRLLMKYNGVHDFTGFAASSDTNTNKVREIVHTAVQQYNQLITIDIIGNAFLHNMVRAIVGTVLMGQKEKWTPKQMAALIKETDRSLGGPTVAPHGLFLIQVMY